MKIEDLIAELTSIKATFGNIETQIQLAEPKGDGTFNITPHGSFFIIPEEYEGGEQICNIRTWPY